MGLIYIIESETPDPDTGEILYWNNSDGYGNFMNATRFIEEECSRVNLPTGGRWKMLPQRFRDALIIQQGACNPSGIARSLHDACRECLMENVSQRTDPAVRLIAHQLAYLLSVREIDDSLDTYRQLIKQCENKQE